MSKKTVLIADDEDNILISLEFLLRQAGYEPLIAHDGREAVDLALAHKPDLLLLDVMMPHKDGFQACQEIRESGALPDVPIVMLTAKGRDADLIKGMAMGADEYIVKPFSTRELMARIRALLGDA